MNDAARVHPMLAMVAPAAYVLQRAVLAERGQSWKSWLGSRSRTELSALAPYGCHG